MISTNIVKILDLVDPDDPVLTGKGLVQSTELWTDGWKAGSANAVLGLTGWEESVEIVV